MFELIQVEIGRTPKTIDVPELVIRRVLKHHILPEYDGENEDDDDDDTGSYAVDFNNDKIPEYEYRLQGRLVNVAACKLSDVKYDVSYFDTHDKFIGLDKCRFLDDDEIDIDDHLSLDFKVRIPDDCAKCVFNVSVKKAGLFSKLFWG
jgi:hypothetical protein